jgi:hypothetical protein
MFERERHDPIEHLGDLRRGKAEISVSTIPERRNQSSLGQLR